MRALAFRQSCGRRAQVILRAHQVVLDRALGRHSAHQHHDHRSAAHLGIHPDDRQPGKSTFQLAKSLAVSASATAATPARLSTLARKQPPWTMAPTGTISSLWRSAVSNLQRRLP